MKYKPDFMYQDLRNLFERHVGGEMESCTPLSASGSHRQYFRIRGNGRSVIGVRGTDIDENRAFLAIARHLKEHGIRVPEPFAVSEDGMAYIQEDLGDSLLYDAVSKGRESGEYSPAERELLIKAVRGLPRIQFEGAKDFDFGICYPESEFNTRMVDFDLNYFKYCFLKTSGVEFHEAKLQDDFDRMKEDLLAVPRNVFMYRDFQARNVMLVNGEPYFIDFQGGRKGPLYYDLASFVWQARARYPFDLKEELTEAYIKELGTYTDIEEAGFRANLRLFVLFRTLQVLGAYGYRGKYEKRGHFLESIPYALDNLRELLDTPFDRYPYLCQILNRLCDMRQIERPHSDTLEVHILSFSFRKGIPADSSGNGGGYVFDCRAIHNPGKYERYKSSTGMDADVIKFLTDDGEALIFMENVYGMVDAHVKRFIERGFGHMQVCFGCTGGRHRSVFCAESLARHLHKHFDIRIKVTHTEQDFEYTF